MVLKDGQITVEIIPAAIQYEIPVDMAAYGNDVSISIEGFPYGYGVGTGKGKLYVYLPPIGGRYHYTLTRQSNGVVIGQGWIEPFKDIVTPNDAYFGVTYPGGVRGVDFRNPDGMEDWTWTQVANFDSVIPLSDGTSVLGKVFFADLGVAGLEVVASGDFWITIQKASEVNGDMASVATLDNSVTGTDWDQTRIHSAANGVGKVVISVIPKPSNKEVNPYVSFHRYYGPYNPGGGKG